jgi:hypothetical protein
MEEGNMNFFGTGAAGDLWSGSTPWLLIAIGLGLIVLGMWCRKRIFPRRVGAGDGQRTHRILPGFPRRDDLGGKDRVAGRRVIPFRAGATLQPRPDDGEKEWTSNEEESTMRTPKRTFRNVTYLLLTLTISAALAACGGGGGGSATSPGASGPATVSVSIASAPAFPAGTTFTTSTASPVIAAPPANSPSFDNVFVTVTKLALIPSTGPEFPDANGELESSSAAEGKGFVTATLASPIEIDLKNLSGDNVATLLNKFTGVPEGEYSKIRVYYDNVVGHTDGTPDTLFHPTAHYHFDVHFVGGNFVIPVTSDPEGGIRFFSVMINVVGLKYHEAGNSGIILLRPQVFAEVVDAPEYAVSGVAQNVNPADNTFDIHTPGGTIVPAVHGAATGWIYTDNTVDPVRRSSAAGLVLGASGLDNGAFVSVIGTFSSGNVLLAREVDITFPDVLTGDVFVGWKGDNTFDLRIPAGDNTVFPMPARTTAYYDNAVDFGQLNDTNITDNAAIVARGYKVTGGIEAFWITIGP